MDDRSIFVHHVSFVRATGERRFERGFETFRKRRSSIGRRRKRGRGKKKRREKSMSLIGLRGVVGWRRHATEGKVCGGPRPVLNKDDHRFVSRRDETGRNRKTGE